MWSCEIVNDPQQFRYRENVLQRESVKKNGRKTEVIYVHLRCSFAFSLFARGIGLESSTRFVSLKIAESAANKTQEIQFPRYVTAPRLVCMYVCMCVYNTMAG